MKEYLAPRLVWLARHLLDVQASFIAINEDDPEDVADYTKHRDELGPWAKRISAEAQFLGLPSTIRQAQRISESSKDWKAAEIDTELRQLQRRFDEETESLILFYLPADKRDFYNKTDLFGEEFKAAFPAANAEITEAGTCFAFDRFTACAFHLARATEIVLRVVFVSLGLPPRIWSATKWKKLTERIQGKIESNNARLSSDPAWQVDRPFYEKANAFLDSARNPIRNVTMHVDVTYPDEGSVRPVWLATEAFMRHVATKLKE